MLFLSNYDLAGKTVLEVGSGRGDTTRKLVELLSRYPASTLIASDISNRFFPSLAEEYRTSPVNLQFLQSNAVELTGIESSSIDYIVCNYTLCALEANPGHTAIALNRFYQILHDGGSLYIEEEFPIEKASTPTQMLWAEKWRILKTVQLATGNLPYHELHPETLTSLCRIIGFQKIEWEESFSFIPCDNFIDFFHKRLNDLLPQLPNANLQNGFLQWAEHFMQKADQIGGMEIPYYHLRAQKGD